MKDIGKMETAKKLSSSLLIALLIIASITTLMACSGESEADKIARELADRLTDSMDFDDSTYEEGDPPPESENPEAPQIESVQGTLVQIGSPFVLFVESEFADPELVTQVIMQIENADGYVLIEATLENGVIRLPGELQADLQLKAQEFNVRMALQTESGLVGNYYEFVLSILDQEPLLVLDDIKLLSLLGESEVKTGRPIGQAGTFFPQVENLTALEEVAPGASMTLNLELDFRDEEQVSTVIFTSPGNDAYKELQAVAESGLFVFSATFSGEGTSAGDDLVFQWAFKTDDGRVGEYHDWTFRVVSASGF